MKKHVDQHLEIASGEIITCYFSKLLNIGRVIVKFCDWSDYFYSSARLSGKTRYDASNIAVWKLQ